ncbi:MAG: hypothetical protein IKM52_05305, partial [Clostridia bacterium]|nr:hypothetical protein [Clostridia bacterium]
MKKRVFTLCLAALLFAGALTGILVATSASEETTFDPDSYNYDALYVDGAILNYSAMDHKAGDTVDPTLTTSESGKQLLLEALNSDVQTDWQYGDGYLEISTGSVVKAEGIFAPGDAENPTKEYTVEYLYSFVDKGLPQTLADSAYHTTYPQDAFYGSAQVFSHAVASSTFATYYIKDEALAELKALSGSYLACADNVALQEAFSFTPNPSHVGDDSDGIFNYEQAQELFKKYPTYYYFMDMDWTNVGEGRISKTVLNVGGNWEADLDWKSNSYELFRMNFGDMRLLHFFVTNTFDASSANYTETIGLSKDYANIGSVKHTFASTALMSDLILAKDVGTRVYAVRVYDHKLTAEEQQQNHIADICRAYRIDPSFYIEADEREKALFNSALHGVRVGVNSKEDVLETIAKAVSSTIKTEKSVYTDLYVQEGLSFMVNPMITTNEYERGALITSLSDLDGNYYSVGSSAKPATYTNRAVNLGLQQGLNFGNILPTEGEYTVRIIYANSSADLPTVDAPGHQFLNFTIGLPLSASTMRVRAWILPQ